MKLTTPLSPRHLLPSPQGMNRLHVGRCCSNAIYKCEKMGVPHVSDSVERPVQSGQSCSEEYHAAIHNVYSFQSFLQSAGCAPHRVTPRSDGTWASSSVWNLQFQKRAGPSRKK